MQDTQSITLPISGKEVIIRNYTTRADDENAETILYRDVNTEREMNSDKATLKFPLSNVMASQRSYVGRLVQSIDGETSGISQKLGELRSQDYEAVEAAVNGVVNENSPKAKEANEASKRDMTKK